MSEQARSGFAFGRFEYDGARAKLLLAGREVPLTARELHLLVIFLSRPGEWLEEAWLERGLWPKAVPPTGELDRLARALTAALDQGADGVATIQAIRKRGYRLLIPVRPLGAAATAAVGGVRPPRSTSGEGVAEGSGERPGLDVTLSGGVSGRSAHRAVVSRGQLAVGLLVVVGALLLLLWWMGPPRRPGARPAQLAAVAPDAVAMRAAAATELGKGLAAAPLFDLASRRAAISHFEAALQLDPGARNQAAAHAALAGVLVLEDEMERARLEAQAALAANIALGEGARLADPLAALAFTQLFLGRDPIAARASAERALAIDALHVGARRALVWVCAVEGLFDDALRELAPASPPGQFNPEVATDEAWILHLAGRPLEARRLLSAVVRSEPLFRRAHTALAALHLAERRLAAAEVEFEVLDALSSGAGAGREDDARRRLREADSSALPDAGEAARLLEARAAGAAARSPWAAGGKSETEAARIYAQFGESALALEALARALERRESAATLARVDPAFVSLRGNAAFRKLLDNAGVPALAKQSAARIGPVATPAGRAAGGKSRGSLR
ncbi:MAG: winged helix-turn-helix domain-containing protein [Thermoanaerobaculia bacterium]